MACAPLLCGRTLQWPQKLDPVSVVEQPCRLASLAEHTDLNFTYLLTIDIDNDLGCEQRIRDGSARGHLDGLSKR